MKTVTTLAVAGILLFSANAFAQNDVNWKPGSTFTFVERDAWNKEIDRWTINVKSKDEAGYSVVQVKDNAEIPMKVSTTGVWTRPMPKTSETFDYQPVKLPIAAGSSWEYTYYYLSRTNSTRATEKRRCEAEAIEEVQVPAGKFKAWRISCKGGWQVSQYSGSINRTMWYSPDLSMIIKVDERTFMSGGGSERTVYSLESFNEK